MTKDRSPHSTGSPMQELPLDFTAFHRMNRPRYIRYALQILKTRGDAEDAVDDVFEHLLKRWPKVLESRNPSAYAWVVMRHRINDYATSRQRRTTLEEKAFATRALLDASDPIGQVEESMALLHAVNKLSERQHEVVVMRLLAGMPEAEVAETLGTNPASVRSNLRHARKRLAEILDPHEPKDGVRDDDDR